MTTVAILSLLTFAIGVWWALTRKRRRSARPPRDEIPLFTIPVSQLVPIARPSVAPTGVTNDSPASFEPTARAVSNSISDARDTGGAFTSPTIRTREGAVSTLSLPSRHDHAVERAAFSDDDAAGEPVDGASVRYWRVADGTLQFLPGRLAISAGRDAGHEIRFVRTAGPDGTCVTFGRAEGAPYRHVQLREPTVSRLHARMTLEQTPTAGAAVSAQPIGIAGRWRLDNLSSTNPVMVNGRALGAGAGPSTSVILSDGDRIEMGEVAFVFHAR